MRATLLEVQTHPPEFIGRAKSGEELAVIDSGVPVARLDALPWIRPGDGEALVLGEPLLRVRPGERTAAEIVSEMRDRLLERRREMGFTDERQWRQHEYVEHLARKAKINAARQVAVTS